jgi:hypothetical protein
VPKGKKIKVLTHRPRYIETTKVPKHVERTSSTPEPEHPTPAGSKGESDEMLKVPAIELAEALRHAAEAKGKAAEELEREKTAGPPKILSQPSELELPKVSKTPAITPKRRRMASVLDAVMESTRASTPAPRKETAEAATFRAEPEAESTVPIETEPAGTGGNIEQGTSDVGLVLEKEDTPKKIESAAPEAPSEGLDFII